MQINWPECEKCHNSQSDQKLDHQDGVHLWKFERRKTALLYVTYVLVRPCSDEVNYQSHNRDNIVIIVMMMRMTPYEWRASGCCDHPRWTLWASPHHCSKGHWSLGDMFISIYSRPFHHHKNTTNTVKSICWKGRHRQAEYLSCCYTCSGFLIAGRSWCH